MLIEPGKSATVVFAHDSGRHRLRVSPRVNRKKPSGWGAVTLRAYSGKKITLRLGSRYIREERKLRNNLSDTIVNGASRVSVSHAYENFAKGTWMP